MSSIARAITCAVAVFVSLPLLPDTAAAQEKTSGEAASVTEALEGFDEPSPENKTDGGGLDSILEGFEDAPVKKPPPEEKAEPPKESAFEINGAATLSSSWNYAHKAPEAGKTDYRGLSRLRGELQLDINVDLAKGWKAFASGRAFHDLSYAANGRDNYTGQVLSRYENEAEFRDVYVQGALMDKLDIKVGRQIVVWGRSDNVRVTDVLNPLDNREPGMVDIEDLRLPVTMTKLDYYFGDWGLSAIAVHEIRFNKDPAHGSDFYPFPYKPPREDRPASNVDNTEYGLALNGVFSGWDISFYWARFFDDQPHVEGAGMAMTPGGAPSATLVRKHSRLSMTGAAGNLAMGNWLLKAETAYFDGLEFFNAPGEEKSRFDALIGVEYSGFTEQMIAIEAVNRHLVGFDPALENVPDTVREDDFQFVVRYQGDFMRDTVHLLALASVMGRGGEDGSFERISAQYDIMDALSVTAGAVIYQSGDKIFFKNIEDNDRVFLDLKYSF